MSEPTLEKLEKMIDAFRQAGGSDAEISAIAQDMIHEFAPEKRKRVEDIFVKEYHPSVKNITDFKENKEKPVKLATKDLWHRWYFRYPVIFTMTFLIIFTVINWPLIVAKFTPVEPIKYETVKEVIRPEMEKSAPLEPGEVIPTGSQLVLPKINVTAPINFINSNAETDIHESLRTGLVHYFGTAKPGEVGNSFITGHSSNYWWEKGNYNYVFANLDKMAVGDRATIYYNGNKFLYEVKNIIVVEPTDISVLNPTDTPTLTLMTCTPPGTNWKRLIVQFNQISPAYKPPVVVEKQQAVPTVKSLPQTDSGKFADLIAKLFGF